MGAGAEIAAFLAENAFEYLDAFDLSIVTYGSQLQQSLAAAEELALEDIHAEVLDLRSLKPLDTKSILASVRETGKVLIVHAANRFMGAGAEIAAFLAENAFEYLDAPFVE